MPRPPSSVLRCPSRIAFRWTSSCLGVSAVKPRCVQRTTFTRAAPRRDSGKTLSARPSPKPWRPDPTHCSGCGVALQFDDNKKAGFAYRQKDPAEGTVERWRKRQSINDVFDDVMKDLDESMLAKLRNTQDNLKDLESKEQVKLRREEEELMEDEDEEFDEDIESHDSPKLVDAIATHKIKDIKPLCLRCHEITFHSNPLNHTLQNLPVHQSIDTIIKNIRNTNRDPSNPPLLVHVLDVADFPLSFIPFDIPTGSKVLFVVNRADILCSQSSALARLRPYFKTQIAKAIQDNNMSIRDYDIHPISAKKGWGTKELLNRIFQLRNAESNVYFIGHTNVGKSSIIASMIHQRGITRNAGIPVKHQQFTPTISVFPHTTLANVAIPLDTFKSRDVSSVGTLYDTPGIEGDSAYLTSLISHDYARNTSLLKLTGFQRPADKLEPGGLIKIDLLECEPHISTPHANHIRITAFTNLPCHITSAEKAMAIFEQDPIEFIRRRSSVEVCVKKALGNQLLTALDLDVTSTGNSARNTIEIVFAGLGFVAIGGNFATCKVRVSTPGGRGTGIRKPVVDRIGDEGCCLPVVRRRGVIRPVKIKKGGGLRVDIGDGVETSV